MNPNFERVASKAATRKHTEAVLKLKGSLNRAKSDIFKDMMVDVTKNWQGLKRNMPWHGSRQARMYMQEGDATQ